ncbi:MAG TPA: sulfite exporter TauE/SafE family protein [Polyangia bacterium]|nr:sulfite exporter TauE/SafE family protein [Polyangia bacterium]
MTPGALVALTLVYFAVSVISVVTGGGSLVQVPALIAFGMAPREAVATNMFAVTWMTASATVRFARAGEVGGRFVIPLVLITAVTSALGAELAVVMPERLVKGVVAGSMIALLAFMAMRPRFGGRAASPSRLRLGLGFAAVAVLGVYGGLFSGGYTTLLTFTCVAALGMPLMQTVGTTKLVNLVSCAVASAVFVYAGLVDSRVAVPASVASFAGGWAGAHLAIQRGEKFVRGLFLVTVLAMAVKLFVDLLR